MQGVNKIKNEFPISNKECPMMKFCFFWILGEKNNAEPADFRRENNNNKNQRSGISKIKNRTSTLELSLSK